MTSNFQGYTTHQDHPHLPCIDAFDPQTRPLLSGMRMPVFLNWSPCIWYSCAPYSRGTKRSHASAMLVLLLYPNSSLIDVILTQDRVTYPHMQYSLQVHLVPAKAPPHSTRALCTPRPGDIPTRRKHAKVHILCTDMEGEEETSRT